MGSGLVAVKKKITINSKLNLFDYIKLVFSLQKVKFGW